MGSIFNPFTMVNEENFKINEYPEEYSLSKTFPPELIIGGGIALLGLMGED